MTDLRELSYVDPPRVLLSETKLATILNTSNELLLVSDIRTAAMLEHFKLL